MEIGPASNSTHVQQASPSATILVVDDEAVHRKRLKRQLEEQQYRVLTAGDGLAALEVLERERPDLVLLDALMPRLNGFETCRRMRASAAWATIPVIILTALDDVDEYIRAIGLGADDFLTKPAHPTALALRVRGYVRARRLAEEVRCSHELQRQLMRMIAHDLNNPVAGIIGHLEIIQRNPDLPPTAAEPLAKAMRSAEDARRLIHGFLELEKLQSGTLPLRIESINLSDVFGEVWEMYAHLPARARVEMTSSGVPLPAISGDRDLLRRVLENLLGNAVKFATPDTPIMAEWAVEDQWVVFRVANRGPVIDPEDQARIFELFSQLPAPCGTSHDGYGLGLSFCRLVVHAHGGTIRVISPVSGWPDGAAFEVRLPRNLPGVPDGGAAPDLARGSVSVQASV